MNRLVSRYKQSKKEGNGDSGLVSTRSQSGPSSIENRRDPFNALWQMMMPQTPFLGLREWGGFRQPAVNIRDTGNSYDIDVELPGVARDNLELNVTGDRLEIRAEEEEEDEQEREGYYMREIGHRSFFRTVPLPPDADPEEVEAELEDGCLCITIGKREGTESHRRRVEIK